MAEMLRLALLGGLRLSLDEAEIADTLPAKAAALLSYLAVTGRPHSRAALAGLLWPEAPEAVARASLRQTLFGLNKRLASHLIITRDRVAFNQAAPYWLDVEHFEAPLTAAGSAETLDIGCLREAVLLYQGDLLAGFYVRDAAEFEEWLTGQRERLRQLALNALHTLAADATERGAYAIGIDAASRLLALEPWHEDTHRQLMLLLALSGRPDAALAQYEHCRHLLKDELNIEPAVETTLLAEQIRARVIVPPVGVAARRHNLRSSVCRSSAANETWRRCW